MKIKDMSHKKSIEPVGLEIDAYDFLKSELQKMVPDAELTEKFAYSFHQRTRHLTIKVHKSGLVGNMQDDGSAFESWAIVLKYYLKHLIATVSIDWDGDVTEEEKGYLHYNRFVYRLLKFVQTYDWAFSAKPIPPIPSILFCNTPAQEAALIEEHPVNSEGWLECKYVMEKAKEYDYMSHQFPVGLFSERVSSKTAFATGKKSAIDIWAIKGNDYYLFELKIPSNRPLGIISETMFYVNVVRDILSHRIQYENSSSTRKSVMKNYRGFEKFYELYTSGRVENLKAVFLADKIHPLITEGLLQFLNDSSVWRYHHVSFSTLKVNLNIH